VDTCISLRVDSSPSVMFGLAARVEDWPRLLPHYRWVRIHRADASARVVEMAARRDVVGRVGVPLWWVAVQTLHPMENRIEFRHIRGITRGMWVEWRISPDEVRIRHVFRPRWPVPDLLVHAIVGEYFVNGVARLTLACLAARAQRPS
jgi:ribosome-associated toxin RatA of RatAB toxin-antitoxin module